MKGGSIPAWRKQSRREAGISPWRKRGFRRPRGEPGWPGVERPCPAGIWSERVEAGGATGRTTWMPVVGLADETSAHEPALRYISRSLVSAKAVHHRASRWRRPAAGWGGCIHLLSGRRDGRVNLGESQRGENIG